MPLTVTSHDYPSLGSFEGYSVLSGRLITLGRVVECSKGFLPQRKSANKWINLSKSLETFEEARAFLFTVHCKEAQTHRGWSDEELNKAVVKVQEKNLKLWSTRLQKRMTLQKELNANIDEAISQAILILSDPATELMTASTLSKQVTPLCDSVFFSPIETSKIGLMRTLKDLIEYCQNPARQKHVLDVLSNLK
jgi:hypothetical protein